MVIALKPDVKIKKIERLFLNDTDSYIRVRFNTGNTISMSTPLLAVLSLLNGHFTVKQAVAGSTGCICADSKHLLDELSCLGLVYELSANYSDIYMQANDRLRNYVVHFTSMSNINMLISAILHKMSVKSIFYEDAKIAQGDIVMNIYYEENDVGKSVISFLQHELQNDTTMFVDASINTVKLNTDSDIIINSDSNNCVSIENCITVNTWNYRNIHFRHFELFDSNIHLSENLKMSIENLNLAIRSVCDILHSVSGELVF